MPTQPTCPPDFARAQLSSLLSELAASALPARLRSLPLTRRPPHPFFNPPGHHGRCPHRRPQGASVAVPPYRRHLCAAESLPRPGQGSVRAPALPSLDRPRPPLNPRPPDSPPVPPALPLCVLPFRLSPRARARALPPRRSSRRSGPPHLPPPRPRDGPLPVQLRAGIAEQMGDHY
ncbi:hypothetical protein DMC30DRAFT_387151 [Rhodotorula diobovata]|uniref:Uncharacterized protein n=1 Tax=Rhodotorula diobovata TaxID=5288 RepID=A0A5C5G5M1_9BASI|nr:hypothetical protein DMC30DRAFT_387151 [Rhodotorula diobovata]